MCGVSPPCLSEIGSALPFALVSTPPPTRCAASHPPTCTHTAGPFGDGGSDHNFNGEERFLGFPEWLTLGGAGQEWTQGGFLPETG